MDWVAAWPTALVLAAVLFVPGLAIGWGLRLRGLLLWAGAPVISTAAAGIAALIVGFTPITWNLLSAGAVFAILAVGAWLVGRLLPEARSPFASSRALTRLVPIGLAVGAVLGALKMGAYIGDPHNISQTNDAVFHLNALRFIAETGNASSLHITEMVDASQFYPAAWHAIASLALITTGAPAAVVANVLSVLLCGPVWALSMALFVWAIARGSAGATAVGAALAPAMLAAPFLTFKFGVLYPYSLALVLVPAVAAVAVWLVWQLPAAPDARGRRGLVAQAALLSLIGLAALALAQPAVILVWLVIAGCLALWTVIGAWRDAVRRDRIRMLIGLGVALAIGIVVWVVLTRSTSGSQWAPPRGRWRALLDILSNGQLGLPVIPAISLLAIVGLVVAVRRPHLRWLAMAWAVFSLIYFVAASVGNVLLRDVLLGAWYGDPFRLAALAPITVIPLAAIGLTTLVQWAAKALRPDGSGVAAIAWAMAGVSVVTLAGIFALTSPDTAGRPNTYRMSDTSFLSTDEAALVSRLPETVDANATVIVNPSTGGAYAYGLTGVDVYPRTWSPPRTDDFFFLGRSLNTAADDPEVCAVLDTIGADYVLDFGPGAATPGRWVMPGMTDFDQHDGFELVDSEGDASLWRITACN